MSGCLCPLVTTRELLRPMTSVDTAPVLSPETNPARRFLSANQPSLLSSLKPDAARLGRQLLAHSSASASVAAVRWVICFHHASHRGCDDRSCTSLRLARRCEQRPAKRLTTPAIRSSYMPFSLRKAHGGFALRTSLPSCWGVWARPWCSLPLVLRRLLASFARLSSGLPSCSLAAVDPLLLTLFCRSLDLPRSGAAVLSLSRGFSFQTG